MVTSDLLKIKIVFLFLFPILISPTMAADHIEFKLAWDANLEDDLDGYEIYFGEGFPCRDELLKLIGDIYSDELIDPNEPVVTITDLYNGVLIDQVTPAFTVPQMEESSTYCIALKAFDKDGNISDFSEKLCVEVSGLSVLECDSINRVSDQYAMDGGDGGDGGGGGG